MSIATEIVRQQNARNVIRDKVVSFGLGTSTDKLDVLAATINNIANRGAVTKTVEPSEAYIIPAGYHNGEGIVRGAPSEYFVVEGSGTTAGGTANVGYAVIYNYVNATAKTQGNFLLGVNTIGDNPSSKYVFGLFEQSDQSGVYDSHMFCCGLTSLDETNHKAGFTLDASHTLWIDEQGNITIE